MNITAKCNLSFNADKKKIDNLDKSSNNKIDFFTKCWSKKHFNYNENIFYEQNLTMNITAKCNLSFNADLK